MVKTLCMLVPNMSNVTPIMLDFPEKLKLFTYNICSIGMNIVYPNYGHNQEKTFLVTFYLHKFAYQCFIGVLM